jgi:hypothetical protein
MKKSIDANICPKNRGGNARWSFYVFKLGHQWNSYQIIEVSKLRWLVVWNMAFILPYIAKNHPNCYSLHHFSEG